MSTLKQKLASCGLAAATFVLMVPAPSSADPRTTSSGPTLTREPKQPPVSDVDVVGQQALLDRVVREVEQAETILRDNLEQESRVTATITLLKTELRSIAVDAYMNQGTGERRDMMFSVADVDAAVARRGLVNVISGDRASLIEQLEAEKQNLLRVRADVELMTGVAKKHRTGMLIQLGKLKAAQDFQIALVGAPLSPSDDPGDVTVSPSGTRTSVRGIVVDRSIAGNVEAMLIAAQSDGVTLTGGGYRDPAAQRRLRRQNCPSANSSPSSCSPPTARPGHSMHEQGLAIDFSYNGSLISSRSNGGYQWLAANAERYGLYNLPSEPWHWSVNGR